MKHTLIERLIRESQLSQALDVLTDWVSSVKDGEIRNSIFILQMRLHRINLEAQRNTLAPEKVNIEMSRIAKSILEISHNIRSKESVKASEDFDSTQMNYTKLLEVIKTANIIIEIEKIKEHYSNVDLDWSQKEYSLERLQKFASHTNYTLSKEVFSFLYSDVVSNTRFGMPKSITSTVFSLIISFFPSEIVNRQMELVELSEICTHIGYSIIYDSFIYLHDFQVSLDGFSIFKWLSQIGTRNNVQEIEEQITVAYNEIERAVATMDEELREDFMLLTNTFRMHLNSSNLGLPTFPERLHSKLF